MAKNNFNTIVEFLQNYKHDGAPIVLSQCETIVDFEKFVDSYISTLKANSGKTLFRPYYDRILSLYEILNERNLERHTRL